MAHMYEAGCALFAYMLYTHTRWSTAISIEESRFELVGIREMPCHVGKVDFREGMN